MGIVFNFTTSESILNALVETFKIPYASKSIDTSIGGVPLGAGGKSVKLNCQSVVF